MAARVAGITLMGVVVQNTEMAGDGKPVYQTVTAEWPHKKTSLVKSVYFITLMCFSQSAGGKSGGASVFLGAPPILEEIGTARSRIPCARR
jgi:hypothetical protein